MKKGLELIAELEAEMQAKNNSHSDRITRIDNCDTDINDCFLSIHSEANAISELNAKISILKNGGVHEFEKLANINGDIIEDSRIVETKYGECWAANGEFISMPSFGCNAGKQVWIDAGFKNHSDAKRQLMAEINTDEYRGKNSLYFKLGKEAQSLGMIEKGYKIVYVLRPAWVTMKSSLGGFNLYPHVFESKINYFTGI